MVVSSEAACTHVACAPAVWWKVSLATLVAAATAGLLEDSSPAGERAGKATALPNGGTDRCQSGGARKRKPQEAAGEMRRGHGRGRPGGGDGVGVGRGAVVADRLDFLHAHALLPGDGFFAVRPLAGGFGARPPAAMLECLRVLMLPDARLARFRRLLERWRPPLAVPLGAAGLGDVPGGMLPALLSICDAALAG
jgi:hypothetical protein